jgi:hypothetical protein
LLYHQRQTNNPQARPAPDPDSIFAQLLQDLPLETAALGREFNAFAGGPVAALGQGEALDFGAWRAGAGRGGASGVASALVGGAQRPDFISLISYSGCAMSVQKFIFCAGILLSARNPADKQMWEQQIFAPLLVPLS